MPAIGLDGLKVKDLGAAALMNTIILLNRDGKLKLEATHNQTMKCLFRLEIPDDRLPSWNQILAMQHWTRKKFKDDLARYSGGLSSDEASKTKIEPCQEKVGKGEQEKTVIEIFEL